MRLTDLKTMRAAAAWKVNIPTPTAATGINITDANARINEGIAELFLLGVAAASDTIYKKTFTTQTSGGKTDYPLPLDFYELKSVVILLDQNGSDRMVLERFTDAEEPYLQSATPGWNGQPFKYSLQGKTVVGGADGGTIRFLPVPSQQLTILSNYIYCPTALVQDGDTLDGFAGFEEYAIVYAARQFVLRTQQTERAQVLGAEMERIKVNVLAGMKSRDAGMPPKVNMTRVPWSPRSMRRGRFGIG